MRVAAIVGVGCSERELVDFRIGEDLRWQSDLDAPADAAVILGGDGTLHRNLPKLIAKKIPTLVIPRGSGNDFARALGLPNARSARAAWRRFCSRRDNVVAADVGLIQETANSSRHYFCTVAGVGLDGEVARKANAFPRWLRGHGGYLLALLGSVFRFPSFTLRITAEGNEWRQQSLVAAFANVPTFGGGMRIAPRAKFDDGKLDLCLIREMNRLKLLGALPSVYFGRHLGLREVEYRQLERLSVESDIPMDVYADGERICATPVEVSLLPGAFPVIRGGAETP
jgi:diacylglycerol kinase (ATP)